MSDKPKRWTWEEWDDKMGFRTLIEYPKVWDKCPELAFHAGEESAFGANEPYIEWLEKENKKQRGRIGNLESLLELEKQDCDEFIKQNENLEAKLALLREALEWYANINDEHPVYYKDGVGNNGSYKARTALKGSAKKKKKQ